MNNMQHKPYKPYKPRCYRNNPETVSKLNGIKLAVSKVQTLNIKRQLTKYELQNELALIKEYVADIEYSLQ